MWECSEVSSFDYLGSPLWNTEFIHTDVGSTTLLSLNDTIYVGGNYYPGQGKSVINRMTLDGKVIDEHVYSDPLNRISSSLINFLYSDNKVLFFSGLGYVGEGGKALIYAISKSMNLSMCYVDTTINNSVVWDAHVGPDSLLTCFIMENSITAPRDRRRIEKYDRNLNLVWKYSPRDSLLLFNNIRLYGTVLNNGSIFYTYYNPINTSSLPSFRLLDTVSKSTVWQYDFSNNNKHNRLVLRSKQLDNQDTLIIGHYSNIGVEPPIRDAPWLMRININGNRVWEHVYVERHISNVNKLGALWDAIELENGDIMACGFVTNNNKWDPLLIRTDADGCIDQGQANCATVQFIDLMSGAVDEIGEATV